MGPAIKKRQYSKNGCVACKRRKAKCDEGKPHCLSCINSGRECSYEKSIKFDSSRSFTIKKNGVDGVSLSNMEISSSSLPIKRHNFAIDKKTNVNPFIENPPLVIQNNIPDILPLPSTHELLSKNLTLGSADSSQNQDDLENFLFDGATNLISDLNEFFTNLDTDLFQTETALKDIQNLSEGTVYPVNDISYSLTTPNLAEFVISASSAPNLLHNDEHQSLPDSTSLKPSKNMHESVTTENNKNNSSNYINTINMSLTDYKESGPINTDENKMSPGLGNPLNKSMPYQSSTNIIRSVGLKAYPCPEAAKHDFDFDYITLLDSSVTELAEKSVASYFNWSVDSTQYKYLKIFFTHIHLNFLPFSTSYINNAYINTFLGQAKNSPHLLFAILAIAAKYEAYQIQQKLRELGVQNDDILSSNPASDKGTPEPRSASHTWTSNGDDFAKHSLILEHEARFAYHMKFRAFYLSSCLQSLTTILLSKEQTLNNIESLLLTILILTSDFSGVKGGQWREHLNGARDLLVNYVKWGTMEKEAEVKRECTIELVIVWLWFYAMEILAAVSSPNGGTIHELNELQTFLPVLLSSRDESEGSIFSAMVEFGFAIKCGTNSDQRFFNMYLGYDECMIEVFNDLVYGIECMRSYSSNDGHLNEKERVQLESIINQNKGVNAADEMQLNSSFVMQLLFKIQRARDFQYISNKLPYYISKTHSLHPSNFLKSSENTVVTSGYIKTSGGNYYSWIDLSQQLFADAALLRLMVGKSMDIDSPFIRDVVERMLAGLASLVSWKAKYDLNSSDYVTDQKLLSRYGAGPTKDKACFIQCINDWPALEYDIYLNYNIDRRLVMVQWPLYVCGLCCRTPEQKIIIECCFDGLICLGVGSGELSLRKLQRIWHNARSRSSDDLDNKYIDVFGDNLKSRNDAADFADSVPFA